MAEQPASQRGHKQRKPWGAGLFEAPLLALLDAMAMSMAMAATQRRDRHDPRLLERPDGRFEVRCLQCDRNGDPASLPIGIGMPIANRVEAESILRNHAARTARRRRNFPERS